MGDVVFSVREIEEFTGGRVANSQELGVGLERIQVRRPTPLVGSGETDLAFFFSRAFENELKQAGPGVLITGEKFVQSLKEAQLPLWNKSAVVVCRDPYLAFAKLSEKFAPFYSTAAHCPPSGSSPEKHRPESSIHPTAVVAPTAKLGAGVVVGPQVVIEDHCEIGAGTVIYAGGYLGPQCRVGKDCVLFPHVTLYERVSLGDRVRIHAGSAIGADGFGYAPEIVGARVLGHRKIYHIGSVVIGDDVEIGANACVDRGTLGDTRIEKNVKIDNHCQVGHNAFLDEGVILCGGTALAGNARIGKYVYVGGLCGISNHIQVGDGAKVGALSLVYRDVKPGETVVGNPQRPYREHFRIQALLDRMLADWRSK